MEMEQSVSACLPDWKAIQKYAGADAKKPKLNKLGGTEME